MSADAPLVRTLAPRYYTDAAFYRRECEGLLARTWQFACHATQIASAGDYVSFEVAGESLFCIRDHDGTVRAFYNVCQHRAHQLVKGSGNARLLVCPYHSWTYELSGALRSGPNVKAVPGFDRCAIRLAEVRVEQLGGFVFVNLDADAAPMDEWFPGVRQELRAFVPQIDALAPVEWIETRERCNWKVAVENYSECYHCRINHPAFANGIIRAETYDIRPQGYCLRHTTRCQNLDRMSYDIDPDANEHAGDYSSWFLWPLFSFQVYPGNVLNTYHWRPRGVGAVDVWRGWYTLGGEPSETIHTLAVQDRDTTVEEDIALVESVQRGLGSRGYRPGPLVVDPAGGVNSEHSIETLQRWMRAAHDDDNTKAET